MRLFVILFLISIHCEAKHKRLEAIIEQHEREDMRRHDEFAARHVPVPFGHIFKEGVEDPRGPYKQAIDLLELDTTYAKDTQQVRDLIKRKKMNYQRVAKEQPMGFLSPKDEVFFGKKLSDISRPKADNSSKSFWNLAAIQQRNAQNPPMLRLRNEVTKRVDESAPEFKGKTDYFAPGSFDFHPNEREDKMNWTTCDEFGRKAAFHPNDIVNLDWVPFYIWTDGRMGTVTAAKIHKFAYPTVKDVAYYKEHFAPHINKTLDWEQPKLLMKDDTMETLLIADPADRKGLFDAIPCNELPESFKNKNIMLPSINIRIKIVDPYLAMTYCNRQYAVIMAISGNEPETRAEKISEAATLKFKGRGIAVFRDLEMERMIEKAKRDRKIEMESRKYIFANE